MKNMNNIKNIKSEKIIAALNKIKSSDETKNEIYEKIISKQKIRRAKSKLPSKIIATAAALVLIVGLVNIQTVWAFVRELLFVPGVGFTDNNISAAMLEAPMKINTDLGEITLEFATKVKYDDGKCEILLYFISRDERFRELSYQYYLESGGNIDNDDYEEPYAAAKINGEVYKLPIKVEGSSYAPETGYIGYMTAVNEDFPDVNEFDLELRDTTAHIVLTELSEDEKIPYMSKENHGITLIAYKFRGTNKVIGLDAINNNDLGDFYTASPEIHFNAVTGENNTEIQIAGGMDYRFRGWYTFDKGISFCLCHLHNEQNIELTGIDMPPFVLVEYYTTIIDRIAYNDDDDNNNDNERGHLLDITKPYLTLPVPKDGETIKTDIKIPVGGIFYEVSEVRREGDTIYFRDNSVSRDEENFDMEYAIESSGVYIADKRIYSNQRELTVDSNTDGITGFNPDDEYIDIYIRTITVVYFGDFSIDLTAK